MDLFLPYPYVVLLLAVPLSLLILSQIIVPRRRRKLPLPPGSKGWPILGETLHYIVAGPRKFIKDRMDKYSADVFQTSLRGERIAVLCGAQGSKFIFANNSKLFATWWPKSIAEVAFFPHVIGKSFSETIALSHSLQHDIYKPEALRQHLPVVARLAAHHMDNHWNYAAEVKLVPLIRKYTFEVASALFFSHVRPHDLTTLFDAFSAMVNGMFFPVPIRFPGTPFTRSLNGGRIVRKELLRIVKERRKEVTEKKETGGADVLSKMLFAKDKNGRFYSEIDIASNINTLLLGLFEPTAANIATVIYNIAHHPNVYQEVLKEQMEIVRSKGPNAEALTWEDIEKMKYTWNTVRESMRLAPNGTGALKEVTTEFTYAGFTIPKGWKVVWTGFSTHMNPIYFPEPDKFDPSRFEGCELVQCTYVPFGGGRGICPGRGLARVAILVFMHNMVTRFKFEKVIPNEKILTYASPIPANGLPLRLYPHKK